MRERAVDGLAEEGEQPHRPFAGELGGNALGDAERNVAADEADALEIDRTFEQPVDGALADPAAALEDVVQAPAALAGHTEVEDPPQGRPCGLRYMDEDQQRR